jgi:hypothetical protein
MYLWESGCPKGKVESEGGSLAAMVPNLDALNSNRRKHGAVISQNLPNFYDRTGSTADSLLAGLQE